MAQDLNTIDLLPNSRKMMLAALLKRAGEPQYSAPGAGLNALALGLAGLYEGQDQRAAVRGMDASVDAIPTGSAPPISQPMGNVPPMSDATPPRTPTLSPQTPTRPMISDYQTGPATVAALRGGPSEADMAANDVADSLSATGMKVSPEAVARLMKVESNNNPRSQSGSYAGATQMGPDTFKEAGGRLGGMTYPEYQNGSLTQQAWAYPDWLQHYNVPQKLQQAGVDTGKLDPAAQYGVLQAAQFAPNGGDGNAPPPWMTAMGQGNPNVPSTTTKQADILGNKSVASMAGSFPAQVQMADASGNVAIPQRAQPVQYATPQQQFAPARQVAGAPASPAPVQMPMDQQMTNLIDQYHRTNDPTQKGAIYQQIKQMQDARNKMQLDMAKTIFDKSQPGFAEVPANAAAIEAAKSEAGLPAKIQLKQTPSAEEKMKLDMQAQAKQNLTATVGSTAKNLLRLNSMDNAIPNSDRSALDNTIASISSSPYFGQPVGEVVGAKEASIRREVLQSQPAIINAIRQATQMGARGLDSNVELGFYQQQGVNPNKDVWSNLAALDKLDKAYGLGMGLKDVLTPDQYARVEKGGAALEKEVQNSPEYKAEQAAKGGPSADGWTTLSNGVRIREKR